MDLAAWVERANLTSLAALVETQMMLQLEAGEVEGLFRTRFQGCRKRRRWTGFRNRANNGGGNPGAGNLACLDLS